MHFFGGIHPGSSVALLGAAHHVIFRNRMPCILVRTCSYGYPNPCSPRVRMIISLISPEGHMRSSAAEKSRIGPLVEATGIKALLTASSCFKEFR